MAFRLQQLAIGNYILEYSAPAHGKNALTETLLRVEGRTPIDEFGQHHVLQMFGVTPSSWGGATFASKTIDTTNDSLKFTPMSHQDALDWMTNNKIPETVAKAKSDAELALKKANLQIEQLAMLAGDAQQAISGEGSLTTVEATVAPAPIAPHSDDIAF